MEVGLSYEVVSPISLPRRWLGKLVGHRVIERLWMRCISSSCVAERSLPECILDFSRGRTFCFEKIKTMLYRRVGEEYNGVFDRVVASCRSMRMSWRVPVNSLPPPSPATHPAFLPSSVSLPCRVPSSSPRVRDCIQFTRAENSSKASSANQR